MYLVAAYEAWDLPCACCAQVPKVTVIIGGSFGAGNYGELLLVTDSHEYILAAVTTLTGAVPWQVHLLGCSLPALSVQPALLAAHHWPNVEGPSGRSPR